MFNMFYLISGINPVSIFFKLVAVFLPPTFLYPVRAGSHRQHVKTTCSKQQVERFIPKKQNMFNFRRQVEHDGN